MIRILIFLMCLPILTIGQASIPAAAKKKESTGSTCPGDVCGNLVAWYIAGDYDGDGNPGNNSGDVQTWVDLSGNGWDLTQSTASLRPTYTSSVLNGEAGLDFEDADPNWMSVSNITDLDNENDFVWFYVVDTDTGDSDFGIEYITGIIFASNDWVRSGLTLISSSFGRHTVESFDGVDGSTADVENQNVIVPGIGYGRHIKSINFSYSYWNGNGPTSVDITDIDSFGTHSTLYVGRSLTNGSYFNGKIMEYIVYDTNLSAGDLSSILTYLENKYNL